MPEKGERLPRRRRLRRRLDFLAIGETGRKLSAPSFLLLVRPAAAGQGRIGITVSRKVGKAVVRNRVKRWIRETSRRLGGWPRDRDVVVVARPAAAAAGLGGTRRELEELVRRLVGR